MTYASFKHPLLIHFISVKSWSWRRLPEVLAVSCCRHTWSLMPEPELCAWCLYYGDLSFTHPRRWSSTVSWRSSTTLNHTQDAPRITVSLVKIHPTNKCCEQKIYLSNWNWQTRHKGKVLQMHVCPMSHWPPAAPPSFRPSFFLFVLMMLLIHSPPPSFNWMLCKFFPWYLHFITFWVCVRSKRGGCYQGSEAGSRECHFTIVPCPIALKTLAEVHIDRHHSFHTGFA